MSSPLYSLLYKVNHKTIGFRSFKSWNKTEVAKMIRKVILTHLLFPRLEKSTPCQIKIAHRQPLSVWLPECESQIQIYVQVIREFLSGETDHIKGKKRSVHLGASARALVDTPTTHTALRWAHSLLLSAGDLARGSTSHSTAVHKSLFHVTSCWRSAAGNWES